MKYVICTVKDRAADAYGRPMFLAAIGQAIRSFTDEINKDYEDNQMFNHPDDFDLYDLGVFDDSNGYFTLNEEPKLLVRGKDVKLIK
jgi:hypothetical protein